MAKGDPQRVQTAVDQQLGYGTGGLENLQQLLDRNSRQFGANYEYGAGRNISDYGDLMGKYMNALGTQEAGLMGGPDNPNAFSPVSAPGIDTGGWSQFAQTGGYSPQDLQNIRDRAGAVNRSVYSQAQDELARKQNISGGYMPNAPAALSQMARQQSYNLADTATNANAQIAQMVQQGKLAGLQGLTGAQGQAGNLALQAADINRLGQTGAGANQNQAFKNYMEGLGGATSLYGTNPAMANVFGNQVINADQNQVNAQQARQQLGQQTVQGQYQRGATPGFDTGGWLDIIGKGAGAVGSVWPQGGGNKTGGVTPYSGGGGNLPSRPTWGGNPQMSLPGGGGSSGGSSTMSNIGKGIAKYAPMVLSFFSDENMKEDIKPIRVNATEGLKKLPISSWKYKGDSVSHIGPMAQDFHRIFKVGDSKTIHLADVSGVLLKLGKEMAAKNGI